LFKIKPDGTDFTKLYDYSDGTGTVPTGNIFLNNDNFIYGYTLYGGANDVGVLYKIGLDGMNYEVIYDLAYSINDYGGALIDTINNTVYGAYFYQPGENEGALFSVSTNGTGYKEFLIFAGDNGSIPLGNLILIKDIETIINNNSVNEDIKIFPIPAKSIIYLSSKNDEIISVKLIDAIGKITPLNLLNSDNIRSIDISDFDRGLYFLRISTNQNKIMYKKIIVQ